MPELRLLSSALARIKPAQVYVVPSLSLAGVVDDRMLCTHALILPRPGLVSVFTVLSCSLSSDIFLFYGVLRSPWIV